jgi:hypothetical protein
LLLHSQQLLLLLAELALQHIELLLLLGVLLLLGSLLHLGLLLQPDRLPTHEGCWCRGGRAVPCACKAPAQHPSQDPALSIKLDVPCIKHSGPSTGMPQPACIPWPHTAIPGTQHDPLQGAETSLCLQQHLPCQQVGCSSALVNSHRHGGHTGAWVAAGPRCWQLWQDRHYTLLQHCRQRPLEPQLVEDD